LSVSPSILHRPHLFIVFRARCLPRPLPAIPGKCPLRPPASLPSKNPGTLLGRRVKSSFARSSPSSEVTGPSDSGAGPLNVLWIFVCDTNLSADGFFEKSLYAVKLTHPPQGRNGMVPCMVSCGRRRSLMDELVITKNQGQNYR